MVASHSPISRSFTLPHDLETSGACYSIVWHRQEGIIVPAEMCGQHEFLHESKRFAFEPDVDYVGRLMTSSPSSQQVLEEHFIISDMLLVGQQEFLRKQEALTSGILSIIFVPQKNGTLLEVGYTSCEEAHAELLKRSEALGFSPSRQDWEEPLKPGFVGIHKAGSRRRASSEPRLRSFRQERSDSDLSTLFGSEQETTESECEAEQQVNLELSASMAEAAREAKSFAGAAADASPSTQELRHEKEVASAWRETSQERFCEPVQQVESPPSLGSLGHPHYCQFSCKFFFKSRGCKDGVNCTRCHLCPWTRQSELLWKQGQMLRKAYRK